MNINTEFLTRCIRTLEMALVQLPQYDEDDIWYDIFRASCVKEFELVLEQSGSLLKKRLRPYFASNRQADRLTRPYYCADARLGEAAGELSSGD